MKDAIIQAVIMYAIAAMVAMLVAGLIKLIFIGVRRLSGRRDN